MVMKADAEKAIRHLASTWLNETNYEPKPGHYPSFGSFIGWLDANGYSHYLEFRSQVGARYEAEGWFESEAKAYSVKRYP